MDGSANQLPGGDVLMAANIVTAYVAHNSVRAADLPDLILQVHAAVTSLKPSVTTGDAEPEVGKPTPAQIRKSITPDALISFIDGKPYKTLKRHLSTHGLDFETYRARYGLPTDYPTVSASYSAARSANAFKQGLGKRRRRLAQESAEPIEGVIDFLSASKRAEGSVPAK